MTKLKEKFIEQVKKEKLKPEPLWHFRLRKVLSLGVLLISSLIGAISIGLVIELVNKLSLIEFFNYSSVSHQVWNGLPYFWIIVFGASFFSAVLIFSKLFYGYRYKLAYVISGFFYLIAAAGVGTYVMGFSDKVESYMTEEMPIYSEISVTPETFWHEPEEGLLYGEIALDPECNCIRVDDGQNDSWQIEGTDEDLEGMIDGIEGPVKIMGKKTGNNRFQIDRIFSGHVKGAADQKKNKDDKKEKNDKSSQKNLSSEKNKSDSKK